MSDIRRSLTPEKRWAEIEGELPAAILYRPLSFPVTALFLNLGIPIMAVTLTSAFMSLAMVVVAWSGIPYSVGIVVAMGLVFHLFDCVDGNMARTLNCGSNFGGLFDGFVDMSFWCSLFVSLGLLVEHAGGGLFGDRAPEFGLLLGILVLLNRQTRDNLALNFGGRTYFTDEIPEKLTMGKICLIAVVGLENLYVIAIAIGGYYGVLDRVLLGMGVYVGLMFVGAMFLTFGQAIAADREDSEIAQGSELSSRDPD